MASEFAPQKIPGPHHSWVGWYKKEMFVEGQENFPVSAGFKLATQGLLVQEHNYSANTHTTHMQNTHARCSSSFSIATSVWFRGRTAQAQVGKGKITCTNKRKSLNYFLFLNINSNIDIREVCPVLPRPMSIKKINK